MATEQTQSIELPNQSGVAAVTLTPEELEKKNREVCVRVEGRAPRRCRMPQPQPQRYR
jgi:hypothetical protein